MSRPTRYRPHACSSVEAWGRKSLPDVIQGPSAIEPALGSVRAEGQAERGCWTECTRLVKAVAARRRWTNAGRPAVMEDEGRGTANNGQASVQVGDNTEMRQPLGWKRLRAGRQKKSCTQKLRML
ncbi:hypothetical protein OPT61_g6627 [Boeremia exigua]|uniref:Uncharacterized protein n=1 Tax=Boeremia exigua TaxID=749465 RepID=A0ACC2I699_9PLEO|nr:hypothetical protein OPT61_g6627 [Boeremia exigua]